jgi:hypothetical protein
VLQKKLSNFEKKIRKAEARKRKILDQLLTLEGYWSGVNPAALLLLYCCFTAASGPAPHS